MAEIDYAFVADFARVEPNGTLSALNASWTHLWVPAFPFVRRLYVAGRVRGTVAEPVIPITVAITGPENVGTVLSLEGALLLGEPNRPYGANKVGHLFALEASVLLPLAGLYEIVVTLPLTGQSRRLAFDVEAAMSAPLG